MKSLHKVIAILASAKFATAQQAESYCCWWPLDASACDPGGCLGASASGNEWCAQTESRCTNECAGTWCEGPQVEPAFYSPCDKPFGSDMETWAKRWWQWMVRAPSSASPITDTTGEFAGVGQDKNGPVWYLGGTLAFEQRLGLPSNITRSLQVPPGKSLFVPVFNWIAGNATGDCGVSNPGVNPSCKLKPLRKVVQGARAGVSEIYVAVDDQPLDKPFRFGVFTRKPFVLSLPQDNSNGPLQVIPIKSLLSMSSCALIVLTLTLTAPS